jgi:hypothetical protein
MREGSSLTINGLLVVFLLFSVLMPWPASFAQSEVDVVVFKSDSAPFGKTPGEWTAEWWKWFISIPTDESPINDPTGENCAVGQSGPAWFLVGSGGGKAERECVIPAGKAIVIPNITTHCSYALNPSLETEEDLMSCAKNDQDLTKETRTTLNGADILNYRIKSPVFDVTIPSDNVFSAPAGQTRAASDGYWVMLTPLPPGNYELRAIGVLEEVTVSGPSVYVEDSTYHLTVVESPYQVFEEEAVLGDELVSVDLRSSSAVSSFSFDEEVKQISFRVSGDEASEGVTILPIGRLLEGPFVVSIDGTTVTSFATYHNEGTGDTEMQLVYEPGAHDMTITGTRVVPEFPFSLILLLVGIGAVVVLGKVRLTGGRMFYRGR